MKNIITVAALLAAGTAFSNAATIALDDTHAAYAVALLDVSDFSSCNGAGFTGAAKILSTITFNGTWDGTGYTGALGLVTNGSSSTHITHFFGSYVHGTTTTTGQNLGTDMTEFVFTSDTDWDSISAIAVAYSFDSVSATNRTTVYAATTFLYTDGSCATVTGSNNGVFWSSDGDFGMTASSIEVNGDVFEYGSEFKTAATLAGLTEKAVLSTIPEPSAFGLLAGIGALALVASRRRRTK